jgi:hypothetical protein
MTISDAIGLERNARHETAGKTYRQATRDRPRCRLAWHDDCADDVRSQGAEA